MIIPRDVFLPFYKQLINVFSESLDEEAWLNKFGHRHKEDSKEWWFIEKEFEGRRRYASLEITSSAEINDNQVFYRIYGKYGIDKIHKEELDWSLKEIRALGAALKYIKTEFPPDLNFETKGFTKKEIEVLEAKILFQVFLQENELSDVFIKYPKLQAFDIRKNGKLLKQAKKQLTSEDIEPETSSKNGIGVSDENELQNFSKNSIFISEEEIRTRLHGFFEQWQGFVNPRMFNKLNNEGYAKIESIWRKYDLNRYFERVGISDFSVFNINYSYGQVYCKVYYEEFWNCNLEKLVDQSIQPFPECMYRPDDPSDILEAIKILGTLHEIDLSDPLEEWPNEQKPYRFGGGNKVKFYRLYGVMLENVKSKVNITQIISLKTFNGYGDNFHEALSLGDLAAIFKITDAKI